MQKSNFQGQESATQCAQMLIFMGCDLTNRRSRNFGLLGYDAARALWENYKSEFKTAHLQSNKIGRNDACPCESGKKYKKCCLQRRLAQHGTDLNPIAFGPDLIPRFWDINAIREDLINLDALMRKNATLQKLLFSSEKLRPFLRENPYNSELLEKLKGDARDKFVDTLALKFIRESGEERTLKNSTELIFTAAKSVNTASELRALASGMIFLASYETSRADPNPMISLIFHYSVKKFLEPIVTIRNLVHRFEIEVETDKMQPAQKAQAAENFLKGFGKKEEIAVQKFLENSCDDVFQCLAEGKFPIGLPFAATLPVFQRCSELPKDGNNKIDANDAILRTLINQCADQLTDEDYQILLTDLNQWLSENKERQDLVSDSIKTLHILAQNKTLGPLGPQLLIQTFRQGSFIFIDEEEAKMVASWADFDESAIIQYAHLLQKKGCSKMAQRTRNLVQRHEHSIQE